MTIILNTIKLDKGVDKPLYFCYNIIMETKKFTFFIKGIKTNVSYDDEKETFQFENHIAFLSNQNLVNGLKAMEETLDNCINSYTLTKDGYYVTYKDFCEVPADIRILLGAENIKLEAQNELSYINLLGDIDSCYTSQISGSMDYPMTLYIPKTENWIVDMYQALLRAIQLSSNTVFSLSYKFKQDIEDNDWNLVLSTIKRLNSNDNKFIITNYEA